jgi:hypothetical protein
MSYYVSHEEKNKNRELEYISKSPKQNGMNKSTPHKKAKKG